MIHVRVTSKCKKRCWAAVPIPFAFWDANLHASQKCMLSMYIRACTYGVVSQHSALHCSPLLQHMCESTDQAGASPGQSCLCRAWSCL